MPAPHRAVRSGHRSQHALRVLVSLLATLAVAAGLLASTAAPASAGQVGVTVGIAGAGVVTVVEGSLEDGAGGTCSRLDNQDHRVTVWCPRFRNSEAFEAWVWLRATPASTPRGHWVLDHWEGCDQTRVRDGHTECAVHSGAFSSDERRPVAHFRDVVAPEVYGAIASTVADKDRTVRFVFGVTDCVAECIVVGRTDWARCTSGHEVTLPEGTYRFAVRASDPSGNTATAFADVEVIDTRISSGPAALSNDPTPSFRLHTVAGEGLWCSLDGGDWTKCGTGPDATYDMPPIADGAHRLLVQARHFGWVDPVPAEWLWTTDTSAASTTIVLSPRGSEAGVQLVNPDAVSYECRLDHPSRPGTWMPCSADFTYIGLVDGPYTMHVRARDAAGNVEMPPATVQWTAVVAKPDPGPDPGTEPGNSTPPPADTTPPDTALVGGPVGFVLSPTATFALTGEADATYRCTLDGTPVACGPQLALSGLRSGTHTLTAAAVDAAGNVDQTPAIRTWTVPLTARELKAKGWRLRKATGSYGGQRLEATRRGATLTRRVSGATALALVVGKGRGHGTVKVYAGSRLVRTVRLLAKRSTDRVLVPVTTFTTPFTGRLRVVVASQGRPVRLEGLGVATR